jgi:hypothetical protein
MNSEQGGGGITQELAQFALVKGQRAHETEQRRALFKTDTATT